MLPLGEAQASHQALATWMITLAYQLIRLPLLRGVMAALSWVNIVPKVKLTHWSFEMNS
jgi:hypothetical protein